MKQYLKRSAAWLLCLAMILGLFAGVPGAVLSKVSAEETTGTTTGIKNLMPGSLEDYTIPNWTISKGVVQSMEEKSEKTWSLKMNDDSGAEACYAISDAVTAYAYARYTATVKVIGAGIGELSVIFYDAEGKELQTTTATVETPSAEEWQTLTVAPVSDDKVAKVAVKLATTESAIGDVYFDDVTLYGHAVERVVPLVNGDFEAEGKDGYLPTGWHWSNGYPSGVYSYEEHDGGKAFHMESRSEPGKENAGEHQDGGQ